MRYEALQSKKDQDFVWFTEKTKILNCFLAGLLDNPPALALYTTSGRSHETADSCDCVNSVHCRHQPSFIHEGCDSATYRFSKYSCAAIFVSFQTRDHAMRLSPFSRPVNLSKIN